MAMADFRKDLELLLSQYSKEAGSDTPDFILAEYLERCLDAFDVAIRARNELASNTVDAYAPTDMAPYSKLIGPSTDEDLEFHRSKPSMTMRVMDWLAVKIEQRLNK